uniref:KaiC-like domain-containing protein n=1 Tax=Fervidicoccus fontis TaxID=683846 RepID=A0A7J3ZLQ0_9CREN
MQEPTGSGKEGKVAEARVKKLRAVSTGNEELDLKLPGGLPYPSLIVVEGDHGTGKSILVQQFVYGMLREGFKVVVFTTETSIKDYVYKMEGLSFKVTKYFLAGTLKVYSTQMPGISWSKTSAKRLLPTISEWAVENASRFDALAIDSLTHLAACTTPTKVLDFFNKARYLTDAGKMVLVTLHENALHEDLATRVKAMCDGYIRLKVASIGGRTVKVTEIVKLNGAPRAFEPTISFDVDPAFGVKVVPITLARA